MAELSFYIENTLVPPPEDWENTTIELSFMNNAPDATVKTTVFTWLGENASFLYKWFKGGITGGLGILEGPAFRIEACGLVVYDGCINMTSPETTFQCDIVKASLKETNRMQFLNDRAKGIPFSWLAGTVANGGAGLITKSDYIAVPYVISKIPDYLEIPILGISLIQLIKILNDGFRTIQDLIDKAIQDSAAFIATLSIGGIAAAAIIVAFDYVIIGLYVEYLIFIGGLALALFISMVNNIVQPLKYKLGMRARDLFTKACQSLNMTFSSTILNDPASPFYNTVIIPKKSSRLNGFHAIDNDLVKVANIITAGTLNNIVLPAFKRKQYDDALNTANTDPLDNAYGYYEGTFAQFIQDMESVFNIVDPVSGQSGLVIRDNVLHFEQWNYWNNLSPFVMPPQSSDAPFDDPYGTNAGELAANYLVLFGQDTSDENTYDQYDGTSCMMTAQPAIIINPRNVLLKNLTEVRLNFALAKRKEKLTVPEEIINAFLNVIAFFYNELFVNLANTFGAGIPKMPTNLVQNNRVGAMLLSSDFTSMPKLLLCDKPSGTTHGMDICKISTSNYSTMSANNIAKVFHSSSWILNGSDHNQYFKFKDKEISLCCLDFLTLRNNNIINSFDNKLGTVDTIGWNPHFETAKLDFRIKERWTNNIKTTIIVDGQ